MAEERTVLGDHVVYNPTAITGYRTVECYRLYGQARNVLNLLKSQFGADDAGLFLDDFRTDFSINVFFGGGGLGYSSDRLGL